MPTSTWWATAAAPEVRLSWAGWWYAYISIPIHQFILLRWYFRLFIWFRFLGQVSRLDLRIVPTHPDRSGGLGFLGESVYAFGLVLFAQGTLLAGALANRIFHTSTTLLDYKKEIAAVVVVLVLLFLAPMLQFSSRLVAAKRAGLYRYGDLASRYVNTFDTKWIQGEAPAGESLVGSADIQSLADLANSFEVVRTMRPVPFWIDTVAWLLIVTALPVAPLILTVVPLEDLIRQILAVLL
jgi:hypothetical protein